MSRWNSTHAGLSTRGLRSLHYVPVKRKERKEISPDGPPPLTEAEQRRLADEAHARRVLESNLIADRKLMLAEKSETRAISSYESGMKVKPQAKPKVSKSPRVKPKVPQSKTVKSISLDQVMAKWRTCRLYADWNIFHQLSRGVQVTIMLNGNKPCDAMNKIIELLAEEIECNGYLWNSQQIEDTRKFLGFQGLTPDLIRGRTIRTG